MNVENFSTIHAFLLNSKSRYDLNKTVHRGKFIKIRVACIHGYSGLKSTTVCLENWASLHGMRRCPRASTVL